MNTDPERDVLHEFEAFDAQLARCYNPNEEAKIMSLVSAVGCDDFNSFIRSSFSQNGNGVRTSFVRSGSGSTPSP